MTPARNPRIPLNATEIRSRRMFDPTGTVSIALGSVVLDRPDRTGRYFAKDLAGGWAYLVGDAEGDNRFRGHGVCEGGLDTTLRCAFLSAVNQDTGMRPDEDPGRDAPGAPHDRAACQARSARHCRHRRSAGVGDDPAGGAIFPSGAVGRRTGRLDRVARPGACGMAVFERRRKPVWRTTIKGRRLSMPRPAPPRRRRMVGRNSAPWRTGARAAARERASGEK